MDYLEQIQLVVGARLDLGISRLQVQCTNHSTTLSPQYNNDYNEDHDDDEDNDPSLIYGTPELRELNKIIPTMAFFVTTIINIIITIIFTRGAVTHQIFVRVA